MNISEFKKLISKDDYEIEDKIAFGYFFLILFLLILVLFTTLIIINNSINEENFVGFFILFFIFLSLSYLCLYTVKAAKNKYKVFQIDSNKTAKEKYDIIIRLMEKDNSYYTGGYNSIDKITYFTCVYLFFLPSVDYRFYYDDEKIIFNNEIEERGGGVGFITLDFGINKRARKKALKYFLEELEATEYTVE